MWLRMVAGAFVYLSPGMVTIWSQGLCAGIIGLGQRFACFVRPITPISCPDGVFSTDRYKRKRTLSLIVI